MQKFGIQIFPWRLQDWRQIVFLWDQSLETLRIQEYDVKCDSEIVKLYQLLLLRLISLNRHLPNFPILFQQTLCFCWNPTKMVASKFSPLNGLNGMIPFCHREKSSRFLPLLLDQSCGSEIRPGSVSLFHWTRPEDLLELETTIFDGRHAESCSPSIICMLIVFSSPFIHNFFLYLVACPTFTISWFFAKALTRRARVLRWRKLCWEESPGTPGDRGVKKTSSTQYTFISLAPLSLCGDVSYSATYASSLCTAMCGGESKLYRVRFYYRN